MRSPEGSRNRSDVNTLRLSGLAIQRSLRSVPVMAGKFSQLHRTCTTPITGMLCIPHTKLRRSRKQPNDVRGCRGFTIRNLGAPSAQAVGISRRHRTICWDSVYLCIRTQLRGRLKATIRHLARMLFAFSPSRMACTADCFMVPMDRPGRCPSHRIGLHVLLLLINELLFNTPKSIVPSFLRLWHGDGVLRGD